MLKRSEIEIKTLPQTEGTASSAEKLFEYFKSKPDLLIYVPDGGADRDFLLGKFWITF